MVVTPEGREDEEAQGVRADLGEEVVQLAVELGGIQAVRELDVDGEQGDRDGIDAVGQRDQPFRPAEQGLRGCRGRHPADPR